MMARTGSPSPTTPTLACPICAEPIECRITVIVEDNPVGEAFLRMGLRFDSLPLQAHVEQAHLFRDGQK